MTGTRRTGLLLAAATAGISGVAVFLNSYGVRATFGSDILSLGNTVIEDNAIDGAPTATIPLR